MSIIRFEDSIIDRHPHVFDYVSERYVDRFLKWVLDWRFRKSITLSPWLKEQVENPSEELRSVAEHIKTGDDYDETMRNILMYTRRRLTYITDLKQWDIQEVWTPANITLISLLGDCEDGAVFMYVLARLKGVPANRLLLFAGDVKGGGHCWLGYRPKNYPLNWVFMDWCYWYDSAPIPDRTFYYIKGKKIVGYPDENYKNIWFGFNENYSHTTLDYIYGV